MTKSNPKININFDVNCCLYYTVTGSLPFFLKRLYILTIETSMTIISLKCTGWKKNVLCGPGIVLGIMPIFCLIYYNQNIITILQMRG